MVSVLFRSLTWLKIPCRDDLKFVAVTDVACHTAGAWHIFIFVLTLHTVVNLASESFHCRDHILANKAYADIF